MRFSIYFNEEELQYLSDYMKKRKIKSKPTAIKKVRYRQLSISQLKKIKKKLLDY